MDANITAEEEDMPDTLHILLTSTPHNTCATLHETHPHHKLLNTIYKTRYFTQTFADNELSP